ncbi:hypothetical protein KW790_03075 [Candidatus Parcubacteria bacterium]|nr:hypothetical protein [Candidatus Parcubacteria bacterium]
MILGRFNRGYTIFEVTIIIAIMVLLVIMVIASFYSFNSSQALDKSTLQVVTALNDARSSTVSSQGATQYGVHLQDDQAVIFKGGTYSSSDANNVSVTINSRVEITNISLTGGGSDVLFDRITGATTASGTLRVDIRATPTTYRTISISKTGIIESQ